MNPEGTFQYQSSLPKLPVPKLQETLQKYLTSAHVLVDDEQFLKTEAIVKEFGQPDGIGEQLYQYILDKASCSDNWLTDWWTKYVYFMQRKPVVLDTSGSIIVGYQPVNTDEDYIDLAAKVAITVVDYYLQIYKQTLPTEFVGKKPMCMMQKLFFFGGSRIPKHDIDEFDNQTLEDDISTTLIISHNNQFFAIEAIKDDRVISLTEMKLQIKRILEMSTEIVEPVGALTLLDRETWADVLPLLIKDSKNHQSWQTIHRGISVISLERNLPDIPVEPDHPDFFDEQYSLFTGSSLHGYGLKYSAGNRWNDKAITHYVGRYGNHGMLGEHSSIDGASIFPYNIHIEKEVSNFKDTHEVSQQYLDNVQSPQKIEWNLTEELLGHIRTSAENFDRAVDDMEMRGLVFEDFGKEFIKSQKMSPDSFVQTALIFSYYSLTGTIASSYESCSTRHYSLGRTETIRSTTAASKKLYEIWTNPKSTNEEKLAALSDAAQSHNKLAREALVAQGWDRLLFGMKVAALERNIPLPELYKDPTFQRLNQFELSTSQMTFGTISNGAFVPACLHGYGVSYGIHPYRINFSCSAYKNCPTSSAKQYLNKVREFFREFHDIAVQVNEK